MRGRPETWGGENARWFGNHWGHSDAKWWVRGQPQFKRVWARIHGTDDLIVSFDGQTTYRPWGHDPDWRGSAQPLHTDGKDAETGVPNGIPQGYTQGFINLVRTTPEAGGNALVPRSHLLPAPWHHPSTRPGEHHRLHVASASLTPAALLCCRRSATDRPRQGDPGCADGQPGRG